MADKDKLAKYRTEIQQVRYGMRFVSLAISVFLIIFLPFELLALALHMYLAFFPDLLEIALCSGVYHSPSPVCP